MTLRKTVFGFRFSSFDAGSPRSTLIFIVPILVVLITFLFWYQTWFGRPLSEGEMSQYLSDTSVAHKTQHALVQLSDRMARGDGMARRWYPEIIALAQNKEPQLRSMSAWVMGQDNHSEEFHQTLRKLVDDPAPLVRWNAALALARFSDAAGAPWRASVPWAARTPWTSSHQWPEELRGWQQKRVGKSAPARRLPSLGPGKHKCLKPCEPSC